MKSRLCKGGGKYKLLLSRYISVLIDLKYQSSFLVDEKGDERTVPKPSSLPNPSQPTLDYEARTIDYRSMQSQQIEPSSSVIQRELT